MSVLEALADIARKLGVPLPRPHFRARYGASRVLSRIAFPHDVAQSPLACAVLAARKAEHYDAGLSDLVRYFHARETPRFFYDATAVLADDAPATAHASFWIASAVRDATQWTETGLPVYERIAPPLRLGFPWGGEWYVAPDADILYPVRPHRFGFLPRLALAALGEGYPLDRLAALIEDWMQFAARNPKLPFVSNLVVTQRLVACACALYLLAGAKKALSDVATAVCGLLLQVIAEDVRYLQPRIGSSYPNNHLLIDRFAAWLIAAVFPELSGSQVDCRHAEAEWLAELERQTYEDGAGFEHSVHYHGLATEAAAAWLLFQRANRTGIEPRHARRVERMLALEADLAGPDGQMPAIGNGAEDPLFPLDGGSGHTAGALREMYRRLFDLSLAPLDPEHPENERVFWMLGSAAAAREDDAVRGVRHYPQGGFSIFTEQGDAARCIFRTGPDARTSTMAGHMHADLMSVYWVQRGRPVLVDSGTWSYRVAATHDALPAFALRRYLAGPDAHNGVVLDGIDPLGPLTGDFRSGAAGSHVVHDVFASGDRLGLVEAHMTGPDPYTGFVRGVVHIVENYFLVYSRLPASCRGRDAQFPMHFDPALRLVPGAGNRAALVWPDGSGVQVLFSPGRIDGEQIDPLRSGHGWISPSYGQLIRAPRVVFRPTSDANVSAFVLNQHAVVGLKELTAEQASEDGVAFSLVGPGFKDYIIVSPRGAAVKAHGIEFEGILLWLRSHDGGDVEIRSLKTRRLTAGSYELDVRFTEAPANFSQVRCASLLAG